MVRCAAVDDGSVFYVPHTRDFVDLNESASEIYGSLLSVGWDVAGAAVSLARCHGVEMSEAITHVNAVIASLAAYGVTSVD